jgi:hypothetical protein
MSKFRKKPVVIDAWQWDETKETFETLQAAGMTCGHYDSHLTENFVRNMRVQTLEGSMFADRDDWIIKGVKGEFYPCKPDIFAATYEPVSEVPVSDMPPHQQRVIDEKRELDEKATKLSNFIGLNPIFGNIDPVEQERLKEQCEIMWQYSEILGKRIAAFGLN